MGGHRITDALPFFSPSMYRAVNGEREVVKMKSTVWFLFGVIGGFVLAHLVNKDPRGQEVLAQVDARITEFTDRISDAYREQEARFHEDS